MVVSWHGLGLHVLWTRSGTGRRTVPVPVPVHVPVHVHVLCKVFPSWYSMGPRYVACRVHAGTGNRPILILERARTARAAPRPPRYWTAVPGSAGQCDNAMRKVPVRRASTQWRRLESAFPPFGIKLPRSHLPNNEERDGAPAASLSAHEQFPLELQLARSVDRPQHANHLCATTALGPRAHRQSKGHVVPQAAGFTSTRSVERDLEGQIAGANLTGGGRREDETADPE